MHCSACAAKIRGVSTNFADVQNMHINLVRRQILVEHSDSQTPMELLFALEDAGFSPSISAKIDHDKEQRSLLRRLGVAGLACMQVMMAAIALYAGAMDTMAPGFQHLLHYTSLLFATPVICYAATPFFSSALRTLKNGGLNMDVPIALAIGVAFCISFHATVTGSGEVYYDSVAMFSFLLLGARYINARLQQRFDQSHQLLASLPQYALRIDGDQCQRVPASSLYPDDLIWVDQGGLVPVDGIIVQADQGTRHFLDEASLTGESEWVEKSNQDYVFAGTLNAGPGFTVQVTRRFDQSRIADIAKLAEQADVQRATITRLTDRIAAVFVPTILILAAATYVAWQRVDPSMALETALAVLVVSCPCALSLATPAALTAAMTRLRQLGVVLTNSSVLERIIKVRRIYLDKTGTLTTQIPSIQRTQILTTRYSPGSCMALAVQLQRHASHPYAKAFQRLSTSKEDSPELSQIAVVTGQGVQGQLPNGTQVRIGNAKFVGTLQQPQSTPNDQGIYLAAGSEVIARFEVSNTIRSDAKASIDMLKAQGISPIILSGDSRQRCAQIADALDIDFQADCSPEAKLRAIHADQQRGSKVLMLGDGINDIPVLAGADVSAVVLEASDLVKSKSDVLLLSPRLAPVASLFHIAKATRAITYQNLIWAAGYNLLAIPFAAAGLMPPWLAALGMAGSSILVMTNSCRLLANRENQRPTNAAKARMMER
jgi:Cu2+-exporting ATPase